MAAVAGWGDTTNMPTDVGVWGADAPDETTWGETPAERTTRLLAEAEQRVAEMEILDSGRLVGIRSDGHLLLLSFFANAEYYLRAQGHKATGETWHKRLGHPSQSTLNNTIKAAVLDKNSLLLPNGLELKLVNRPAPCTICPAANLPHEPFPTNFPGADDYQLMDKVYSDILNLPEDGFNGERYVITRLFVPARDCIFYENLTLPVFEQHLPPQQNPATLFHGVRSFANADVELAASEEPDSNGALEAAPDPPVPVTSSGIPEFIPLADAAPEDVREQHLNRKLAEVGFRQLPHDPGMYRLDDKGSYALLVAYVDDILYVSSSTSLGDRIEADLKKSLDLTISTKVTQFLGLNVSRTSSAIHLTASKYAESLAKRFNISTDFVATPYRSTLTGHDP
ncbi:unnamed protein product [Closterium sp. NIES-54]